MPDALAISLRGMATARTMMDVAAQNLANTQTPGYTKKVSQPTSLLLNGEGAGVQAGPVQRLLDPALASGARDQTSVTSHLSVKTTLLQQIEQEFGAPGDKNSLGEVLKNLSNAFASLASTPTGTLERKDALRNLENFTQEVKRISVQIQKMRQSVDSKIATAVGDVNTQLELVASLNQAIMSNASAGLSTGELEDQRDTALKNIAQHIDIKTSITGSGALYIQTGAGTALLFPEVIPIGFAPTTAIDAASVYNPLPAPSTLSPLTVRDAGGNLFDITAHVGDGDIAAYLEMRDTVLPALQQQLDRLSADFRDGVNKVHNLGTGFPPPNTLTGSTVFADPNTDMFLGAGTIRLALVDKTTGQRVGPGTYDLDLTALGNVTLVALAGNLQAGLAGLSVGATAAFNPSNQLVLDSGDPNIGIALVPLAGGATETGTGRGFSHYFGLNDLIVTPGHGFQGAVPNPGICQTLSVRADIVANDQYLARGQLSAALLPPAPPERVIASGDGSIMTALVSELTTPRLFLAAGGMTNLSVSYMDYGSAIISRHADDTRHTNVRAQGEIKKQGALDLAIGEQSGVDMQEQFSNMMAWQQVYMGSGQVIRMHREMWDSLMGVLR